MTRWLCKAVNKRWMVGALVATGLAVGVAPSLAQGTRDEESRTGKVERLTTAPQGEIDGAVLDDGTVLHWPPHLDDRFGEVAKAGNQVTAVGQMRTGRKGETRFEVRKLTNTETNATAENDERDPGPRRRKDPPPPPRRGERMETVQGTVERLTTAPKGEVDGAVLRDGTVLHWPPHLEDRFTGVFNKGDRVKATGFHERTKKGDEHFEVASLTNLRTDETVQNEDRRDRGPGRPPRPRDRDREDERGRDRDRDRGAERDQDREGEHDRDRGDEIRELKEMLRQLERRIERLERDR